MPRNFDDWFASFRRTINTYDYFVDFDRVVERVSHVKRELHLINSLIGSKAIEADFLALVRDYPQVISALPLLIAVREEELWVASDGADIQYIFQKHSVDKMMHNAPEEYLKLLEETGFLKLLSSGDITNVVDYIMGVEAGLDSNARKSRTGKRMEVIVEGGLSRIFSSVKRQVSYKILHDDFGVDTSALPEDLRKKRFDFAFSHNETVYLVETNFYNSGGSKQNETARGYQRLAQEIAHIDGIEFVWITDGYGWEPSKSHLERAFNSIRHMYNLTDLEAGLPFI